jgi:phytoene dehydrogenase-like protein
MSKSVLIIGAGVAGLATGCYAQMNGYQAQIFELHDKPGGLCTAWKRKGYTIDGCIHHLAGASPTSRLYPMWEELGVMPREMAFEREFTRIESPEGKALIIYSDVDMLEEHLRALSPADAKLIGQFCQAARRFMGFELLALPLFTGADRLKMLTMMPTIMKWGGITLEKFAAGFSDPFLRRAFPMIQYDFPNIPAMVALSFLAGLHTRKLGWPKGGSLEFARAIESRFTALGGQMHYRARVDKVLVEGDRAVGVRLADGSEARADLVVSAADGYATIYHMLDGKYTLPEVQPYFAKAPDSQQMNVHVALGVNRELAHQPRSVVQLLAEPATICGQPLDRLDIEQFGAETGLAPQGKGMIKALFTGSYSYWKDLAADRARYDAEKEQLAEAVITALEPRYPGLRNQIEMVDVATPLTVERYTGNYHGLQCWGAIKGGMLDMLAGSGGIKTLPGLRDFYMVGQWAGGTIGISTVAGMGRNLVAGWCKAEGRRFETKKG